jgi:hypothetical protein
VRMGRGLVSPGEMRPEKRRGRGSRVGFRGLEALVGLGVRPVHLEEGNPGDR